MQGTVPGGRPHRAHQAAVRGETRADRARGAGEGPGGPQPGDQCTSFQNIPMDWKSDPLDRAGAVL